MIKRLDSRLRGNDNTQYAVIPAKAGISPIAVIPAKAGIQIFLLVLLFFVVGILEAASLYRVDVLVFKRSVRDDLAMERIERQVLKPNISAMIDLPQLSTNGLQHEATLLQNAGNQIIFKTSWVQPMDENSSGRWMRLRGGEGYNAEGLPDALNPVYWEVDGGLKISRAKFFDLDLKLFLSESVRDTDFPLQTYVLTEKRRMISRQLNYFDHPLFGVLITISPAEELSRP